MRQFWFVFNVYDLYLQIVWHETLRQMPSNHPLLRAGDARQRAGLPRPVLLLRNLPFAADERRPLRDERRRRALPPPLRDVAVGTAARDVPRNALSVPVPESGVSPSLPNASRRPRRAAGQTALFQRRAAHPQAKRQTAEEEAQRFGRDDREFRWVF